MKLQLRSYSLLFATLLCIPLLLPSSIALAGSDVTDDIVGRWRLYKTTYLRPQYYEQDNSDSEDIICFGADGSFEDANGRTGTYKVPINQSTENTSPYKLDIVVDGEHESFYLSILFGRLGLHDSQSSVIWNFKKVKR